MNKTLNKKIPTQMKLQKLLRSKFVLFPMLKYERYENSKNLDIYITL